MPHFSDLSNELLLAISRHIRHPKDLDSWFLASKNIRNLNEAFIPEHNILKRRYGWLTNYVTPVDSLLVSDFSGRYIGGLANLLMETLISPRVLPYIEEAKFHIGNLDAHQERDALSSNESKMLIRSAVEQSKYIYANEIEDWMSSFEDRADGSVLGLLFTQTPNLRALLLNRFRSWEEPFLKFIIRISEDHCAAVLSSLTSVTLCDMESPIPLHVIQIFATLPSLRQLRAEGVCHNEDWSTRWMPDTHSNVTSLSLGQCQIRPEPLFLFLNLFASLESFEYTEAIDANAPTGSYESTPFWIRNCLVGHSRHSLKKLTIRSCDPSGLTTTTGSFRTFNVLEELDIDLDALISNAAYTHGSLTKVLPTSIRRVVLRHPTATVVDYFPQSFSDLLLCKERPLPDLTLLAFKPYRNAQPLYLPWRLQDAFEKRNISIITD